MIHQVRSFDLSGVQGLSKKAIDLHLGLYKGYVDNLNKLLEQAPKGGSPLAMDGYHRRFAFEYNGVKLHELFFEQLAGKRRQPTDSEWADSLTQDFGGFNGWKDKIEALATTRGIGWVMTLRERGTSTLHNYWVDLHHMNMPADSQIVFVLDLWEHAFMIDFTPAQKADYVKNVLQNIDWAIVEERYAAAERREAANA